MLLAGLNRPGPGPDNGIHVADHLAVDAHAALRNLARRVTPGRGEREIDEQLAQQLSPAVQAVVQANNVQLLLNPSAALYMADPVEMTDEIMAQLNQTVPTVSTAVPQGWQPQQQSVNLFQQVQEILLTVAQQQAAAAQQPAAATPVQGR